MILRAVRSRSARSDRRGGAPSLPVGAPHRGVSPLGLPDAGEPLAERLVSPAKGLLETVLLHVVAPVAQRLQTVRARIVLAGKPLQRLGAHELECEVGDSFVGGEEVGVVELCRLRGTLGFTRGRGEGQCEEECSLKHHHEFWSLRSVGAISSARAELDASIGLPSPSGSPFDGGGKGGNWVGPCPISFPVS